MTVSELITSLTALVKANPIAGKTTVVVPSEYPGAYDTLSRVSQQRLGYTEIGFTETDEEDQYSLVVLD